MSESTDYRALLVKYAAHVLDTEGCHFLGNGHRYGKMFTDAENRVLDEVMAEVDGRPVLPPISPEKADEMTRAALRILHNMISFKA